MYCRINKTRKKVKILEEKVGELYNSLDSNNDGVIGDYNDLINKPTDLSLFDNDVPYVTENLMNIEVEDANGHNYVEIGGIKWATMNIGASNVTDTGLYFQWGDTNGYTVSQVGSGSGKKYFSWIDYKYGDGTSSPGENDITKYNSTDEKTNLDSTDDAARANWGGSWRMPTTEEFVALHNAVNTVWTSSYQGSGVSGLVLTDKTDNNKVLFFPACGDCSNGSVNGTGSNGYFWSNSLFNEGTTYARSFHFSSGNTNWQSSNYRLYGFPVRGILDSIITPKYATKQELTTLETDMNNKISAAYHHAGTKTVSQLTASLLVEEHEGEVYNIIDNGTTTSDFLEGLGFPIKEGNNVGVARIVNGNNTTYKFDLLSGFVDTTNFVLKSSTSGLIKNDGTVDTNTYLTLHQDISNLVASTSVRNILMCTQADYDDLVANNLIDANTEYNIIESI